MISGNFRSYEKGDQLSNCGDWSANYRVLQTHSIRPGTRFPPGATWTTEGVNFSVFSRAAKRVELLLYDSADSAQPVQFVVLDPDTNRSYFFWHVFVEDLSPGTHYTWRVDGGKELVDPWARAVTDSVWVRRQAISGTGDGGYSIRGVVTTPIELPARKSPITPGLEGAVIYELHLGGFTRHPSWDAGGLYHVGAFPGFSWTEWNGRYRDVIRRFVRGDRGIIGEVASCIAGSSDLYAHDGRLPANSIDLITCHDGFTLRDLVSYNRKHNEANGEDNRDGTNDNLSWNCGVEGETTDPAVLSLCRRQAKNFIAILMISRGVPMVMASYGEGVLGRESKS